MSMTRTSVVRVAYSTLLIMMMAMLGACNTIEGMGHDLSAAGDGLADIAADMNPDKN